MNNLKNGIKLILGCLVTILVMNACHSESVDPDISDLPAPQISGFSPQQGMAGAVVTIKGQNYSLAPSEDYVTFGDTTVIANSATTTMLKVKVPEGIPPGKVTLVVTVNGKKATADSKFTILKDTTKRKRVFYDASKFVMGADLSYTNQILDHGGVYRDSGKVDTPYKMFSEYGANVIRFRLWKNPEWEKALYSGSNILYSSLPEVTEQIRKVKQLGMKVLLDIMYSNIWTNPGTQKVPDSWRDITSLDVLKDTVYQYTKRTLQSLNQKGLMPEYVQIGNETNCGILFSNAPKKFPKLNGCKGHWKNLGVIFNSAIKAVRDVAAKSNVDTKIILHVAQPESVEYFFSNIINKGGVEDFDIIGFSYYSAFSNTPLKQISSYISNFSSEFNRPVMIMETVYQWTTKWDDNYDNVMWKDDLVPGYPATPEGQKDYMVALTQEVITGSGDGIFYWEPDWITSNMKTRYGIGSSYENTAFFDFKGNVLPVIDFMTHKYNFTK